MKKIAGEKALKTKQKKAEKKLKLEKVNKQRITSKTDDNENEPTEISFVTTIPVGNIFEMLAEPRVDLENISGQVLETSSILATITSNMDLHEFSNRLPCSSPSTASRPLSPYTPPGTPPTLGSTDNRQHLYHVISPNLHLVQYGFKTLLQQPD